MLHCTLKDCLLACLAVLVAAALIDVVSAAADRQPDAYSHHGGGLSTLVQTVLVVHRR